MYSKAKAQPSGMFLVGEDLPLFSHTPITVHDRGYAAKRDASQPALPGMPPVEHKRKPPEDLPLADLPLFYDLPEDL
jgi:hypothetical protein